MHRVQVTRVRLPSRRPRAAQHPQTARDLIAADIRTIAAEPEVVARLSATGQVVNPGSPSEFAAALAEQRAAVAELGKALGIKPAQ